MDKVSSDTQTQTPQVPQPTGATSAQTDASHPALSYRAQLIQKAFAQVPFTAEGLPVGYYRVDLLPNTPPKDVKEEVESLRAAYADLSFEHGYPTLHDSRPFWQKLDFEPGLAYAAFQMYLEQIDFGPREISLLAENQELLQVASQSQGHPQGQLLPKATLRQQITEFSTLYYWRSRAKAYDLYKEAAYRHLRLRRQMNVENKHFEFAETLMQRLKSEVFEAGDSFWAELSPKVAVDLLKALVAIQRVSTGLPAAGPLSQKETPENTTFEMIMRSLGQKTAGQTYEHAPQASRQLLDTILQDGDAASNLQEVIIRVTRASQEALPNPHEGPQARRFKGRPGNHKGHDPYNTQPDVITQDDLVAFDISGAPGENLDNDSHHVD